MARDLKNQTNIIAPTADYPDGRIKDAPAGVPVDEKVYGDFHQYFFKVMREAGVTPNDLPDNTTNEFQHWEAFRRLAVAPQLAYHGIFSENLASEEFTSAQPTKSSFVTTTDRSVTGNNRAAVIGTAGGGVISGDVVDVFNGGTGVLFSFGAGILDDPTDVWYDIAAAAGVGRIYVTDQGNNIVHVFNGTTGANIPGEEFGSGTVTNPQGIFIKSGKAYIADGNSGLVRVFNVASLAAIPAEDLGFGFLNNARDVFIVNDKAYVPDLANQNVDVFRVSDTSHIAAEILGAGLLSQPTGIHIIGEKAYVTDNAGATVDVFVFDTRDQVRLENDNFLAGILNDPQNIFIRGNKAYVADSTNSKLNVFKQNHIFEHI